MTSHNSQQHQRRQPELLNRRDFARLVGVSAETLKRWRRNGKFLPFTVVSGRDVYSVAQEARARELTRQHQPPAIGAPESSGERTEFPTQRKPYDNA